jgi:hypothetical protein
VPGLFRGDGVQAGHIPSPTIPTKEFHVPRKSIYLRLETQIAADERGGIIHRWRYGRELLEAKAGRQQLPHGMLGDLVKAAEKAGLKLSEREIRYRLRCAEVYATEQEVGTASADFGSWTALREAGFPPVESTEPDDLEAAGISTAAPDEFEQLSLIPGLAPTFKVNGRKVLLEEATVADVEAYRDMYRQIHENYGKRLALIEVALEAMLDGSDGDLEANALEAWKRASEPEA